MAAPRSVLVALVALSALASSCGSSGDGAATATTVARPSTTTTAVAEVTTETLTYGTTSAGEDLHLDLTRPEGTGRGDRLPLMVLVHGGGFNSGSRTEYRAEARALAERGWAVAAVDYELSFPGAQGNDEQRLAALDTALTDVEDAIRWLDGRSAELGIDPDRVVAFGESAGGTTATGLAYIGEGPPLVRAAVSASGRTDPALYPEFGPGDRPMLFVTWDEDPADDLPIQRANCRAARAASITCENEVLHGDHHGLDLRAHLELVEGFFAEAGVAP